MVVVTQPCAGRADYIAAITKGVESLQAILSSNPNITFLTLKPGQSAKNYISTCFSVHADPITGWVSRSRGWMMAVNRVASTEASSIQKQRFTERRIWGEVSTRGGPKGKLISGDVVHCRCVDFPWEHDRQSFGSDHECCGEGRGQGIGLVVKAGRNRKA